MRAQQDPAAPRAWPRVKWTRAGQVAPLMGEEPGALAALPPAQAFATLRAADPAAAARFAAHCLPRVDAVRWLAECIDAGGAVASQFPSPTPTPTPPPARAAAAKAVRRWAANPSDEARRLAFEAGATAGWETVEGLACLAVYFSGGSLAPATQEAPVNPPPGAFGQAAGGAVLLAAQAGGATAYPARLAAMLDRADAIASAGGLDRADAIASAGGLDRADAIASAGGPDRADAIASAGGLDRADTIASTGGPGHADAIARGTGTATGMGTATGTGT